MGRIALCLLLAVVVCLGCSRPPNVDTVRVSGTVTQNGKPLEPKSGGDGSGEDPYIGYQVEFVPVEGQDTYAANVLNGGKFSLDVPTGKYKVTVRPYDETGGMVGGDQVTPGGGQGKALKTLEVEITGSRDDLKIEI